MMLTQLNRKEQETGAEYLTKQEVHADHRSLQQ